MVVVLREMTGTGTLAATTDFDPLEALTLQTDIAQATGAEQALGPTIDAVLRIIEHAIPFDAAEVLLWQADSQTLRTVSRSTRLSATGSLIPPEAQEQATVAVGEGWEHR